MYRFRFLRFLVLFLFFQIVFLLFSRFRKLSDSNDQRIHDVVTELPRVPTCGAAGAAGASGDDCSARSSEMNAKFLLSAERNADGVHRERLLKPRTVALSPNLRGREGGPASLGCYIS